MVGGIDRIERKNSTFCYVFTDYFCSENTVNSFGHSFVSG